MTVPITIRLPSLSVWNSLCPCPTSHLRQRKQTEANPLMRIAPGYPASQTFSILFEAALNRTFEELENWKRGDDLRPLLYLLARHCYKAGIPEEEAVRQVMMHYYREADEQLVRMTCTTSTANAKASAPVAA